MVDAEPLERLLGVALDQRPARRPSCGTFVVRKISSRGTPLSAIPRPTSRSFSYARAVSICRYPISSASRTPSVASCPVISQVPNPRAGTARALDLDRLVPLLMPESYPIATLGNLPGD